jgi:DNA-directed RNA polymerase sigma subunit (sigma70/sigma32)
MGSINAELDDDGMTPESCGEFAVRTASDNDFNAQMEKEELEVAISKMMKVLNDKERDFITRHIVNEESYYAIAEVEGYTVERVRQIVTGGLKKMKSSTAAKTYFACFLK